MIVLGLDTTGSHCACAIVDDSHVLARVSEPMKRGHAERLAPMVANALQTAGLSAKDIDRIGVCTGPGSFTGQRVALAFARGFALPHRLPVIGLDALRIKAQEIRFSQNDALIGVMRDIRRGQVFYGSYQSGEPLSPPRAMSLAEVEQEVDRLQAALYETDTVDTRILAWLAMDASPERHPPVSLYSRAPDAKLPGGIDP